MPDMQQPVKDQEKPSFISGVLNIAAYPIAIVVGLFYGDRAARNSVYDTIKHAETFKAFRVGADNATDTKTMDELVAAIEKGEHPGKVMGNWQKISATVDKAYAEGSSVIKPLAKEQRIFDRVTKAYFKRIGYGAPVNTHRYFTSISTDEAIKAAATGVGTAGLAVGAIVALANHKALRNLFNGKEQEEDQSLSK